jgi:hypothetical protein
VTGAWELIDSEHKGLVGRRAVVAKTFRMPDGSETVFTVTGDAGSLAVACVALTNRQTVVLAEQYRPGPERLMTELPAGCERRQEQELDTTEFITVREVAMSELVTLAMTGRMTDPGGVLLALPYLMGDQSVREMFAPRSHQVGEPLSLKGRASCRKSSE